MNNSLELKEHGKGLLVTGDTKSCKDDLKSLGGKWNPTLNGWVYSPNRREDLEKYMETGEVNPPQMPDLVKKTTISDLEKRVKFLETAVQSLVGLMELNNKLDKLDELGL